MTSTLPRPPYDPELGRILPTLGVPPTIAVEMIPTIRSMVQLVTAEKVTAGLDVMHEERIIKGKGGDLVLSIFRSRDHSGPAPCFYFIHGGGMMFGDRFSGVEVPLEWVVEFGAVCVSVEYRLAPEHPDPAPIEDCYSGLQWVAEHADEAGIDPELIIIAGGSAGGGLAAGVVLLARDQAGPAIAAQILVCPMIDDRNETLSSRQYVDEGVWSRGSNHTGWSALLGDRRFSSDISVYAAPARATDLSGLPPAFIDVGSAEVFRDEDVAYASALWAHGVQAELHVWPGGFHGFDSAYPSAALSRIARSTRTDWVRRFLANH